MLIDRVSVKIRAFREQIVNADYGLMILRIIDAVALGVIVGRPRQKRRCELILEVRFNVMELRVTASAIRWQSRKTTNVFELRVAVHGADSGGAERVRATCNDNLLRLRRCVARIDTTGSHIRSSCARRGVVSKSREVGILDVFVGSTQRQWPSRKVRPDRPNLIAVELPRHAAQTVQASEREPGIVQTLELDSVVDPVGAIHVVEVARVRSEIGRSLHRHFVRTSEVNDRVVLTPEGQRTDTRGGKPHVGLATELVAALSQPTVVDAEPIFQHEQRAEATSQVFGAAQSPATALNVAATHEVLLLAASVIVENKANIDDAIQRDRALRIALHHWPARHR